MPPIGKVRLLWDWVLEYLEAFWYIVERLFFVYSLLRVEDQEGTGRGSILQIYVAYFQRVDQASIQELFPGSEHALEV
jgi:hypothetical protein